MPADGKADSFLEMTILSDLVDYVALVYHEARNVRHLITGKLIDGTEWKYLVNLPKNRNDAWADVQKVRQSARLQNDVPGIMRQFERRFHIDIDKLEELYSNPGWRNSSYGGNAWLGVTRLVHQYAEYIDQGCDSKASEIRISLETARHNNGTIAEKLRKMDEWLSVENDRPEGRKSK